MSGDCAVAIDFGTTYFRVCICRQVDFELIKNKFEQPKTPSCVAYVQQRNQWLVGEEAKRQAPENIANTFFSSKRMLGRPFGYIEDLEEMKYRLFEIKDENGKAKLIVKGEERTIFPIEIVARILCEAKTMAEEKLGLVVTKAVIAVPACFDSDQREHTILAARVAGLQVSLINDTMAAAIAYMNVFRPDICTENLMVVSVGSGSYDVSIIAKDDDTFKEQRLTFGEKFGGQDIDARLAEYYYQKLDINSKIEPGNKFRFVQECVKAKERLSECDSTTFSAQSLDKDIIFKMTTEHLKEALKSTNIISGIKNAVDEALKKYANVSFVLIGGSTRMKCIQECVPKERLVSNVEEAVAYGAAYYAYKSLNDICPILTSSVPPMACLQDTRLNGPDDNDIEIIRTIIKDNEAVHPSFQADVGSQVDQSYIIQAVQIPFQHCIGM